MSANHDYLVFQLRIRSGNLRNRIEAMLVIAGELRLDVDLQLDRDICLQQPVQPPILLNREHSIGNLDSIRLHLRCTHQIRSVVVEDDASTAALSTITAWRQN